VNPKDLYGSSGTSRPIKIFRVSDLKIPKICGSLFVHIQKNFLYETIQKNFLYARLQIFAAKVCRENL
jgi:hypothetical protein